MLGVFALQIRCCVCCRAGLSECILGRRLGKSQTLRCSNWESRPLCPEQQQYAALDAVASLRLHEARNVETDGVQPCHHPTLRVSDNSHDGLHERIFWLSRASMQSTSVDLNSVRPSLSAPNSH